MLSDFRDKKITVMGLGLLGRGIGDVRFFAEHGANLIVTDLKTEVELAPSIAALANVRDLSSSAPGGAPAKIVFHLGAHHLEDFENRDLIVRAPNAPLDSPFLAHARENGIPVEMDSALFAKLCAEKFPRGVTIVGITGTRGKSTVTQLVYEMARAAFEDKDAATRKNVYLGGNVRDMATLPLIEKVRDGDIVVLELDSWQLQGFEEDRISPHIAVWTNFMPDHMNYYHGDVARYFADKAAIARFQHAGDVFIAPRDIKERVEARFFAGVKIAGTWTASLDLSLPEFSGWEIALPGEHNRSNAACAIAAARALAIPDEIIKKTLKTFAGLPNRLELLGEKNGVAFYNDSNSTTPEATIAALKTIAAKNRCIILIAGGSDKELDFGPLAHQLAEMHIKKTLKKLILFEGKASDKLEMLLPETSAAAHARDMDTAFDIATKTAASGDIVVLSPGATSFGIFKNEYDRAEQFRKKFEGIA